MIELPVVNERGTGHVPAPRQRQPKPDWLRVRAPGGASYTLIKKTLRERGLYTVCEEAHCPNVGECWGGGTATFMLLGGVCTRGCRFCAVSSGDPGGRVDAEEPRKLAESVAVLGLRYVVLTMVDRDDLPDGGAAHVASCVGALRDRAPQLIIEALVGDFQGEESAIDVVCESGLEVFGHNIETVERLQRVVRDSRCGYRRSLGVLEHAKAHRSVPYTKSSIMLGLGENEAELLQTLRDLRSVGVDFLTLGQYLQPTARHLPVREFVTPAQFEHYRRLGEAEGFRTVASGPLVRSSYRAGEIFVESLVHAQRGSAASTVQRRPTDQLGGEGCRTSC